MQTFKKIIVITVFIIVVLAMFAGLFFEQYIQEYFPRFTSINFASVIIIMIGSLYGLVQRNVIVPIMFFFIGCVLPWIKYWIITYGGDVQMPWHIY